ncbi:TIM barrel protein [Paenibacillus filicis]|uniref:TIM barrel protein n=1 Tax=Paenibacillus gyeongsangnamensis TaxID=3388067 RepID=A0ABT4QC57_9BACL|nr:TIM barrel protein [Paenibacillus filicis]MCZ8514479.1 TIM barrel protein [Paenibacillus filicis]
MKDIVVPTSVLQRETLLRKGQEGCIGQIAASGAFGVELRRELFPEGEKPLRQCREELDQHGLFCVYSAPIELWDPQGQLNESAVLEVISEAKVLQAGLVKTSLGHYDPNTSDMTRLVSLIRSKTGGGADFTLTVENDQTAYGGKTESLTAFFKAVTTHGAGIRMTFDIGNWTYCGEDAIQAARLLADHVVYIHCKHVVTAGDRLETVALPEHEEAPWRELLRKLPDRALRAIEFSLPDERLLPHYMKMLCGH